jgi:hypothetical protein
VVEQGTWRIRNNQEIREPRKDLDLVGADMTSVRMDHGRIAKNNLEPSVGKRRMGKPRWRWWKDIERDLRNMRVNIL